MEKGAFSLDRKLIPFRFEIQGLLVNVGLQPCLSVDIGHKVVSVQVICIFKELFEKYPHFSLSF